MGRLEALRYTERDDSYLPVSVLRPDLTREIIDAAFYRGLCAWNGHPIALQWSDDRKREVVVVAGIITRCAPHGFVLQTDHWRTYFSWVDLWIGDKTVITPSVRQQVDRIRQSLITAGSPVIALNRRRYERQTRWQESESARLASRDSR